MPRKGVRYNAAGRVFSGGRADGWVCEELDEGARGRLFHVRSGMSDQTDERGFESKVVAGEDAAAEPL